MPNVPALARFHKLVDDISRLYVDARRVQVRFALETGRRIVEEEQDGAMRAAYGSALLQQISKVLTQKHGPGFSESNLRKMRHFYMLHPKQSMSTELDWSDYVELLPVKDEKTRQRLERRILKEDLNSVQIRRLVRQIRREPEKDPSTFPPLKRPADLRLDTFAVSPLRAKLKDGEVLIDCGFFVNWPVKKEELKGLDLSGEMSYTYAATVDRVIDGDTLLALVEAGFRIIMRDRLRLRGIDCPEMDIKEGQAAKAFVQSHLKEAQMVIVRSSRPEKYDRYLADVFIPQGEGPDPATDIYLNNLLLEHGHAVRME